MKEFKKIFSFGENVKGYDIPVLNEREVRGASGILFFFATLSIFFALFQFNFYPAKIFVTIFMIDFIIRVLINPKYAPTLILARWIVSNQVPEYVGAPQKRFAWTIGLVLSVIVFSFLVIMGTSTVFTCLLCFTCLIFLFLESVFGICLGCKMYHFISSKKAKFCPGGVCEVHIKQDIQKIDKIQWGILILAFAGLWFILSSGIFKDCEKNDGNKLIQKSGAKSQQCDISKFINGDIENKDNEKAPKLNLMK